PVSENEVPVKMIELEQETLAVESAGGGKISGLECFRPLPVQQDDEIAGLPVHPGGFGGEPAGPCARKVLLEGDVPQVLHQDQAVGRIGSENVRNGSAYRFQDAMVAEQGCAPRERLRMHDQDGGLLSGDGPIKPSAGSISGYLAEADGGAERLLEEGQGRRIDQGGRLITARGHAFLSAACRTAELRARHRL